MHSYAWFIFKCIKATFVEGFSSQLDLFEMDQNRGCVIDWVPHEGKVYVTALLSQQFERNYIDTTAEIPASHFR